MMFRQIQLTYFQPNLTWHIVPHKPNCPTVSCTLDSFSLNNEAMLPSQWDFKTLTPYTPYELHQIYPPNSIGTARKLNLLLNSTHVQLLGQCNTLRIGSINIGKVHPIQSFGYSHVGISTMARLDFKLSSLGGDGFAHAIGRLFA